MFNLQHGKRTKFNIVKEIPYVKKFTTAVKFKEIFLNMIKQEEYTKNNIYNTDIN